MLPAVFDAIPELVQALQTLIRCIVGDDRGIDRADGSPYHPIRLDTGFVHRLIHADLVRAKRTTALQYEHILAGQH